MLVYVIRHGKAERDSPTGLDVDRDLRGRGERQAAWLGEWMSSLHLPPGLLLASEAVRAWRTASLIGISIDIDPEPEPRLLVGESVSGALDVIQEHAGEVSLALVGHEPQVSGIVGVLAGGLGGGLGGGWPGGLRTGECVLLDIARVEPGGGRVLESVRLDEA